jgi:hypothetical protein
MKGKHKGSIDLGLAILCTSHGHSPKDYAVWEIHPVMKLEVIQ